MFLAPCSNAQLFRFPRKGRIGCRLDPAESMQQDQLFVALPSADLVLPLAFEPGMVTHLAPLEECPREDRMFQLAIRSLAKRTGRAHRLADGPAGDVHFLGSVRRAAFMRS